MSTLLIIFAAIAVAWILAYHRLPAWVWTIVLAIGLGLITAFARWPQPLSVTLWVIFVIGALLGNPTPIRRALASRPLLGLFRKILPQVSQTEQEALEAGTVWWDGELFSGNPDWRKLLGYPKPALTADERAFIDGPVEELCRMVHDWEISHELLDLPPHVWKFIRDQGFIGMIIPREYGGLGFSALAHSEVIMKLTTRGSTAAITVMVPNSLGPAELLLHYGTQAQKNHYLPRLARGIDIPCFALTSPEAGSDAGAIPDFGIVCRGEWEGKQDVLGMRLTWEKRYITLAPVATLLGLAFRLYDPEHILGDQDDIGITLALIPTQTPGVHIGRRHFPLNAVFMNGPTWGKDVFVPLDTVIGGAEYVGQGWKMLMNCLAAGRSISLPANACGIAKGCALTTGAYGRVRQQFRLSIGRFEGVEEALARIGGNTYIMDAARVMTAGAVDLGEKPSVVSAIVKYHLTERGRQVINDAMDIHGGKGICLGPSNYLARAYQQTPIAITVEGANILTRSLIIFGQGAIRGHPFVLKEIQATQESDRNQAVRGFDEAFFGHLAFIASNKARAFWMGLTGARFVRAPGDRHTKRYYQQLTRLSAAFAWIADVSMFLLGGSLKRRERLSARLGDILSNLYLASAALKRYEDEGRQKKDLPLLRWSLQDALAGIQSAFDGVLSNYPSVLLGAVLRVLIFPLGRWFAPPSDRLGHEVASILISPCAARDRLCAGMYLSGNESEVLGAIEAALGIATAAEAVEAKIHAAQKSGAVRGERDPADAALGLELISCEEHGLLARYTKLRERIIAVDDFPQDFGLSAMKQPGSARAAAMQGAP